MEEDKSTPPPLELPYTDSGGHGKGHVSVKTWESPEENGTGKVSANPGNSLASVAGMYLRGEHRLAGSDNLPMKEWTVDPKPSDSLPLTLGNTFLYLCYTANLYMGIPAEDKKTALAAVKDLAAVETSIIVPTTRGDECALATVL